MKVVLLKSESEHYGSNDFMLALVGLEEMKPFQKKNTFI